MWRSWLAHLHGVQGVVRSSRITPTKIEGVDFSAPSRFKVYIMYITYILYSPKVDKFYTGQTKDLYRRLEEHNRGKTSFLASGIPWILMFSKEIESRTEALKLEKQIKKRGAARFLNDNISGQDG